jgi:integrase
MPRASKTGVKGLRKDKRGRYLIDLRWQDPRTGEEHRYQENLPEGTTGGAAKLRAQLLNASALDGSLATAKGGNETPRTLGAALDRYLEWCAVNGRGDPAYKKRHVAQLKATLDESSRFDKISELAIEKHKKLRRAQRMENSTINRELVTLKHFLNRCVDWGWLAKRPKVVLLQEPAPRVRWLTDEERKKLAAALSKPKRVNFRRVCEAALRSGQRLSNLIGLKKTDVDLKHRTFVVTVRKGGTIKAIHVPISDALAAVFKEAMAESKCDHVFVSERWGKPYTRSGVSGFFRKLTEQAGIVDFHFHDLRHDYATQVLRAGHGLNLVQELLGHASPAMTQRYAHLGQSELHNAVEAVVGIE